MAAKQVQNLFWLASLLFICLSTSAQNYKVKTKAPDIVFIGEQFSLDYIIETNEAIEATIEIDNGKGLDFIYGPTRNITRTLSNKGGKSQVSYITTFTYLVEGNQKAKIELPRATIYIDGKKYRSDIAKIEIKSVEDTQENIDAFVKTIVSRPLVNLSDTLMLTYRLYTTKEIEQVLKADLPMTEDFFASSITPSRQLFKEEKVNGKLYKTVDVRTLILQPRSIGQKTIPAGSITVEYSIPTGRKVRDVWGQVYNETISKAKTLTIDSVKIGVQNLQGI